MPAIESHSPDKDSKRRGRSVAWIYFSRDMPDALVKGSLIQKAGVENTAGEDIDPHEISHNAANIIMRAARKQWDSDAVVVGMLLAAIMIPEAIAAAGAARIASGTAARAEAGTVARAGSGAARTEAGAAARAGRPPSTPAPRAVPKIDAGQQGKHIPGSRNYDPRRSTLTKDANRLAEKAGTGEPVNKIPRGQPGFRERVDFGEVIGEYTDGKIQVVAGPTNRVTPTTSPHTSGRTAPTAGPPPDSAAEHSAEAPARCAALRRRRLSRVML